MSSLTDFGFFVGVDIARLTAVVTWVTPDDLTEHPSFTIAQTPAGQTQLQTHLDALSPEPGRLHITLEVSGNYHERLAHFLYQHGWAVSVVNPFQVKRFADVFLQRDKNDRRDAWTLARFGAHVRPALWSPPSPLYAELNQHFWQRTHLIRLHTALANRCRTSAYRYTYSPTVAARDTALLRFVQRQIDSIDRACVRLLNQEPDCAATARCIVTIPGVGMTTAVWLICLTQNFTTCTSPKQLASFIGLVPHRRQSGTSLNTFTAVGHVGHDAIRQHLYIATLSCLRYNPVIKAFYDQLKARRYSHKLACVAATRKLLHIIWAVATKHTTFDPDYARKLTERT